jgi:hypothetical protein
MAYEMKNQTGSFFQPRADQSIFYQGKIKIGNQEVDSIIIKNLKKDGETFYRIFTDIGGIKPLTESDKAKYKQNPPSVNGGFTKDYVEYWITAWSKVTKDGDRMLSATIEPKEEQKEIPKQNESQEFETNFKTDF